MADEIISVFNFRGRDVRTDVGDDGEPLFCGTDVARVLGYAVPKDAISAHCKGAVKRRTLKDRIAMSTKWYRKAIDS
jgi:prophage antirepressor-like protein